MCHVQSVQKVMGVYFICIGISGFSVGLPRWTVRILIQIVIQLCHKLLTALILWEKRYKKCCKYFYRAVYLEIHSLYICVTIRLCHESSMMCQCFEFPTVRWFVYFPQWKLITQPRLGIQASHLLQKHSNLLNLSAAWCGNDYLAHTGSLIGGALLLSWKERDSSERMHWYVQIWKFHSIELGIVKFYRPTEFCGYEYYCWMNFSGNKNPITNNSNPLLWRNEPVIPIVYEKTIA